MAAHGAAYTGGVPNQERNAVTAHVLFVCTGNICRSPFAERLAAHLAAALPPGHPSRELSFASAGVGALTGHPMDEDMAAELTARGGNPAGFAARQLSGAVAREADLILALEPHHRQYVLEEWPALVRRTLLLGQAARVLPALRSDGVAPLDALRSHRGPVLAADAIADPYRRGAAAAATAAAQIASALRVLLAVPAGDTAPAG